MNAAEEFLHIPDTFQRHHGDNVAWNAACAANISYSDDGKRTVVEDVATHSLSFVAQTNGHAPHPYVLLVNPEHLSKNQASSSVDVYIAFQGTKTANHLLTDIQALAVPSFGTFRGKIHRGFLTTAMQVKIEPIIDLLVNGIILNGNKANVSNMIFCGHSLGGAIAQLVALRVAMDFNVTKSIADKIQVFGFGTPLVGDEDYCNFAQEKLGSRTHFYIYGKDIVPRLMSLAQTALEEKCCSQTSVEDLWNGTKYIIGASEGESNENMEKAQEFTAVSGMYLLQAARSYWEATPTSKLMDAAAAVLRVVTRTAFGYSYGNYYMNAQKSPEKDKEGNQDLSPVWRPCLKSTRLKVREYFENPDFSTVAVQDHALTHYLNVFNTEFTNPWSRRTKVLSAHPPWGVPILAKEFNKVKTTSWFNKDNKKFVWKLCLDGKNLSHIVSVTLKGRDAIFKPSPGSDNNQLFLSFDIESDIKNSLDITFICEMGKNQTIPYHFKKLNEYNTSLKNGRIAVMDLQYLFLASLSFSLLGNKSFKKPTSVSGSGGGSGSWSEFQDGLQMEMFDILSSFTKLKTIKLSEEHKTDTTKLLSQPGSISVLSQLRSKEDIESMKKNSDGLVELAASTAQAKSQKAGDSGGNWAFWRNNGSGENESPSIKNQDEASCEDMLDSFELVRDGFFESLSSSDETKLNKPFDYWLQRSVKLVLECQMRIISMHIGVNTTVKAKAGYTVLLIGVIVFGGVALLLEGGVAAAAYTGSIHCIALALARAGAAVLETLKNIDKAYNSQLQTIMKLMNINFDNLPLVPQLLENEIIGELRKMNLRSEQDILALGADDKSYEAIFKSSDMINVLPSSRKMVLEFLSCVDRIHRMRNILSACYTIGVMGSMKTGKSTFLRSLGFTSSKSQEKHTTDIEMHFFPIKGCTSFRFLDFPGNDDQMVRVADCFNKYHNIADAFIIVAEADKADSVWVKGMLQTLQLLHRPILICVNKADKLLLIEDDSHKGGFTAGGCCDDDEEDDDDARKFCDKNQMNGKLVKTMNKLFDMNDPDPLRAMAMEYQVSAHHTILDNSIMKGLDPEFRDAVKKTGIYTPLDVLEKWVFPLLDEEAIECDQEVLMHTLTKKKERKQKNTVNDGDNVLLSMFCFPCIWY